MATRQAHLKLLAPYLIGEEPRTNGEWDMFCPLHEDTRRSASLNVESSEWFCNASCGGGSVVELISRKSEWVDPPGIAGRNGGRARPNNKGDVETLPSEATLSGWTSSLLGSAEALDWVIEKKGLNTDTIVKYEIGWNREKGYYTIPIRDADGTLVNVRRYDPNPGDVRRKIWGYTGHNDCRIYPIDVLLENDDVDWHEGEWDTLLCIQNGIPAVTRTGSSTVWQAQWGPLFKGKRVTICQDCDTDGQKGARKVETGLKDFAVATRNLVLPYDILPKHGSDYTDFYFEFGHEAYANLRDSLWSEDRPSPEPSLNGSGPITVLDSFDAMRVGQENTLLVTIKGKKEPGYTLPRVMELSCDQLKGTICKQCVLNGNDGQDEYEVAADNPLVLEMIDSSVQQVNEQIARAYGVPGGKCAHLKMKPRGHQSVEILFARPSIDYSAGWDIKKTGLNYMNIKMTSVGRHDTMPNTTVEARGALWPNPRSHSNEWLAHEVRSTQTSVDHFELTPEAIDLMRRFQAKGVRPLKKLVEIERELARHVTHIYGRPEMHALIDLTFHSVLEWNFAGELEHRGWLEALILGDTRTGKSKVGATYSRHFGVGEVIGGESASIAGLLGGLQTFGQGKEWVVNWGAIPQNHKRHVTIDEASGLRTEDIAKMSDARSSGIVNIKKIQSDVAAAQTRLLWLSNPRDAKMADFTYGVQAIHKLIGNNEDIARFDIVMCVNVSDVPDEKMNRPPERGELLYSAEACNTLVRWVWTRQPENVVWAPGAEETVYKLALDMGRRYVEDPPLVQAANVRLKICRVAIALAARLFSTDRTCENVVVKPEHVRDAIAFMDRIYGMKSMGYAERSREILADREEAKKHYADIKIYLYQRPGLAKFMRTTSSFRRQDLEEVLNVDRASASGVVNTLLNARMVRKSGADVIVEPALHELLREVKA